jgi:exonuclease III
MYFYHTFYYLYYLLSYLTLYLFLSSKEQRLILRNLGIPQKRDQRLVKLLEKGTNATQHNTTQHNTTHHEKKKMEKKQQLSTNRGKGRRGGKAPLHAVGENSKQTKKSLPKEECANIHLKWSFHPKCSKNTLNKDPRGLTLKKEPAHPFLSANSKSHNTQNKTNTQKTENKQNTKNIQNKHNNIEHTPGTSSPQTHNPNKVKNKRTYKKRKKKRLPTNRKQSMSDSEAESMSDSDTGSHSETPQSPKRKTSKNYFSDDSSGSVSPSASSEEESEQDKKGGEKRKRKPRDKKKKKKSRYSSPKKMQPKKTERKKKQTEEEKKQIEEERKKKVQKAEELKKEIAAISSYAPHGFAQIDDIGEAQLHEAINKLKKYNIKVNVQISHYSRNKTYSVALASEEAKRKWIATDDLFWNDEGPGRKNPSLELKPPPDNYNNYVTVQSWWGGKGQDKESKLLLITTEDILHLAREVNPQRKIKIISCTYSDNHEQHGVRYTIICENEEDAFFLINECCGKTITNDVHDGIELRFTPYFNKYKPPICSYLKNHGIGCPPNNIKVEAKKQGHDLLTVTQPPGETTTAKYFFAQHRTNQDRKRFLAFCGTQTPLPQLNKTKNISQRKENSRLMARLSQPPESPQQERYKKAERKETKKKNGRKSLQTKTENEKRKENKRDTKKKSKEKKKKKKYEKKQKKGKNNCKKDTNPWKQHTPTREKKKTLPKITNTLVLMIAMLVFLSATPVADSRKINCTITLFNIPCLLKQIKEYEINNRILQHYHTTNTDTAKHKESSITTYNTNKPNYPQDPKPNPITKKKRKYHLTEDKTGKNKTKQMGKNKKEITLDGTITNKHAEICHEAPLTIIPNTIQIFVKHEQGTATLLCSNYDTVKQIKTKIRQKTGIHEEAQRLSSGTKPLRDHLTLLDYNLQENTTLYLHGNLCGGAPTTQRKITDFFQQGASPKTNLTTQTSHTKPNDTEVGIASCNLRLNPENFYKLDTLGPKKNWLIIGTEETGLVHDKISHLRSESTITLRNYTPIWHNHTTKELKHQATQKAKKSVNNKINKEWAVEKQKWQFSQSTDNPQSKNNLQETRKNLIKKRQKNLKSLNKDPKITAKGGLSFLVHKSIAGACYEQKIMKTKGNGKQKINHRAQVLKIKKEGQNSIYIMNVYAPTGNKIKNEKFFIQHINPILENWNKTNKTVLLMGDYNCMVKENDHWTSNQNHKRTFTQHKGIKQLKKHGWTDLYPHYNTTQKYTCKRTVITNNKAGNAKERHHTQTRIDHIFTNNKATTATTNCDILDNHSINTDHNPIHCTIKLEHNITSTEYLQTDENANTRKWQDKNLTSKQKANLNKEISKRWQEETSYDPIWDNFSVETNYAALTATLTEAADSILTKHVPTQAATNTPNNEMLGKLKKLRKLAISRKAIVMNSITNKKNIAELTLTKTHYQAKRESMPQWNAKSDEEALQWVEETNKRISKWTKKINKIKNTYKQRRIAKAIKRLDKNYEKGNNHFFNKITTNLDENQNLITSVEYQTETGAKRVTNDWEIVKETHKSFWETLYKGDQTNIAPTWTPHLPSSTKTTNLSTPITNEEVKEMIKEMKNTSPGIDNISMKIIKQAPVEIVETLTKLYNHCLIGGQVPQEWKKGQITLLHKKGPKHDVKNYRPITLLQCIYKIYSNILTKRLSNISEKQILHKSQSGYRKGKSILDNCRALKDILEDAKTRKKEVHLSYIDFYKAFDSQQWWHVENTLQYYKIDPNFINAIKNIYNGRESRLKINSQLTDFFPLNQGTPQGDPLSPLLFILCINPLLEAIYNKHKGYKIANGPRINALAYCDDLLLIADNRKEMEEMLQTLGEWGIAHGFHVNENKSAYSHNSETNLPIKIQGKTLPTLPPSDSYLYLGIWFNINLDWTKQQKALAKKFKWRIKFLLKKRISAQQAITAINSITSAYISWSLSICDFPDTWLKSLDQKNITLLSRKLRCYLNGCPEIALAPTANGGLGMNSLIDLNDNINTIATIDLLNKNSIASMTIAAAIRCKTAKNSIDKWRERMKQNNIKIYTKTKACLWHTHNITQSTKRELKRSGLYTPQDLLSGGRLPNRECLNTRCLYRLSDQTWHEIKNLALHKRQENTTTPTERTKYIRRRNKIIAWTDGSYRKEDKSYQLTAAVFFNKKALQNKTINITKRSPSSFIAEAIAMETCIASLPQENAHIITDSLSIIMAIEQKKKNKRKITAEGKDIIKRIKRLIRLRAKQELTTEITHIYSHISEKKEKLKGNKKKFKKFKTKLRKMKEGYGPLWTLARWGNQKADKLASCPETDEQDKIQHTLLKKTGKYIAFNGQNGQILSNKSKFLNDEKKRKHGEQLKAYPKRGKMLRNSKTDIGLSNTMLRNKDPGQKQQRNITLKARTRLLPTRNIQHKKYHHVTQTESTLRDPPRNANETQKQAHLIAQQTYFDNLCLSCGGKEDIIHIFSGECPARHDVQSETAYKVRELLQTEGIYPNELAYIVPLWIPDPFPPYPPLPEYPFPEWTEFRDFPKEEGALGMCPKALAKIAKNPDSTEKILTVVREGGRDAWLDRCADHRTMINKKEIKMELERKRIT